MALIHEKMIAIMRDTSAIGKDSKNVQQNYKFRGIDTVYNDLHPILAKHGVFTIPEVLEDRAEERTSRSGGVLIYRILKIKYHFFAEDGTFIEATVIGEGMDSGDKASNKSMAVAHKYALLQALCIPTEDKKDPEHGNPDPIPKDNPEITKWKKIIDKQFSANKNENTAFWAEKRISLKEKTNNNKVLLEYFDLTLFEQSKKEADDFLEGVK